MSRCRLALCLLLLMAAPAQAASVRDMLGREVPLRAPPKRIVSLAPDITEVIYALEAQELLVGVTTFCDFPPAALEKPRVGGMVDPSLEAIVSLRPDLVLATTEGNRDSTVEQLAGLGISTYMVSPKNFAGVLESVSRIGQVTGRREAAGRVVAGLKRRADRVVEATRGRPRPSVLYLLWADPVIVPGRGTLVDDLIRLAGGASVSGEEPREWPQLSLEQVIAKAPDVVIIGTHSSAHVTDTLRRWREQKIVVPAFRNGRVHTIDGNLVHRPGPRVVDGLEALARAIHPGALE